MAASAARGVVRAKTGTTDISSALSGYVGARYVFVEIENGDPVDWTAAHDAQDRLAETLASHCARLTAAPRPQSGRAVREEQVRSASPSSGRRSLRLRRLAPRPFADDTAAVFFETLSETRAPSASSAARPPRD